MGAAPRAALQALEIESFWLVSASHGSAGVALLFGLARLTGNFNYHCRFKSMDRAWAACPPGPGTRRAGRSHIRAFAEPFNGHQVSRGTGMTDPAQEREPTL
jgi:hypothetical protein